MTISGFVEYVKQIWKNKPDRTTPITAATLTHMEDGIKGNSDAINEIAQAVVDNIVNDPQKIASMASLYAVNESVKKNASDIKDVNNNLSNSRKTVRTPTNITTGTNILKLDPGFYAHEDNKASNQDKLNMGFPVAAWHSHIHVFGFWANAEKTNGYLTFIVEDMGDKTAGKIYYRALSWESWSPWKVISMTDFSSAT